MICVCDSTVGFCNSHAIADLRKKKCEKFRNSPCAYNTNDRNKNRFKSLTICSFTEYQTQHINLNPRAKRKELNVNQRHNKEHKKLLLFKLDQSNPMRESEREKKGERNVHQFTNSPVHTASITPCKNAFGDC